MNLCPNCRGFAEHHKATGKGGHIAGFTDAKGIYHSIPDIWLAGRSTRIEAEQGLGVREAYIAACREFVLGCEIELAMEAKRQGNAELADSLRDVFEMVPSGQPVTRMCHDGSLVAAPGVVLRECGSETSGEGGSR